MISTLCLAAKAESNIKSDDENEDLSRDVYHCIDTILAIPMRDSVLGNNDPVPSKVDRRQALDYMFMKMLELQDRENSLYR